MVQALPLDGMAAGEVASPPSAQGWDWTPEISPPEIAPPEISAPEIAPAEISPPEIAPPEVAPPEIAPGEISPAEIAPPPSWGSLLGLSDAEAFEAWCTGRTRTLTTSLTLSPILTLTLTLTLTLAPTLTLTRCTGRTGAPLVDAGMIQLWSTG